MKEEESERGEDEVSSSAPIPTLILLSMLVLLLIQSNLEFVRGLQCPP